jgi:hypothetical protein
MAVIIPFRSQFDIDAESATAAALFETEQRSSLSNESRKRFQRRRNRLFGLSVPRDRTPQYTDIID